MSVEVYSNCQVRIEQRGNIENIDKALVELRHYEILQFFLEIYDRTNRQVFPRCHKETKNVQLLRLTEPLENLPGPTDR